MPTLCSIDDALISAIICVTREIDADTSRIAVLARSTSTEPSLTCATDSPISSLISFADCAERCDQPAHFARDDRKATCLLARARRFHGGIQRENVGLERDAVDDRDDFRDLVRVFAITRIFSTTSSTTLAPR